MPRKKSPTPQKLGRKPILNDETKTRFLTAIKAGNYRDAACAFAGVARPTFYVWMKKGEEAPDSEYGKFRHEVIEAEAMAEAQMVMIWRTQMPGDYRAVRDFLERRYPDRWARREIITHDGLPENKADNGMTLKEIVESPGALTAYNEFLVAVGQAARQKPGGAGGPSQ